MSWFVRAASSGAVTLLAVAQAILALRVLGRLMGSADGRRIPRHPGRPPAAERVSVLVPVLDEAPRLAPCLEGLIAQGPEVAEILVVDGGSTDGTPDLICRFAQRDSRVRLIDATPLPSGANGKAHGLHVGLARCSLATAWVLTMDADVRPDPLLVRSLLAQAAREGVPSLSVATQQRLSGSAEGLVHPAMLATLVYRFGIPGRATRSVARVQANGQCFLARRDVLETVGGFAAVADSVCEDVTLARAIAVAGHRVGFYETDSLVSVEMYGGWRDAWRNWPRSLPLRDRFARRTSALGLAEVTLVQALPLWLAPLLGRSLGARHPATVLNLALLICRAGVLAGMARAYERRPLTYWLSPLCDLPVALRLWASWRRRRHVWRGRVIVAGGTR
jgi:dolichol-phosphate mannosyltransferase